MVIQNCYRLRAFSVQRKTELLLALSAFKGPASVLDRFVASTNELGASAYWQALDKLLSEKDR
jgi:hypothetical protein